jgi:hypothetical protein
VRILLIVNEVEIPKLPSQIIKEGIGRLSELSMLEGLNCRKTKSTSSLHPPKECKG